MKVEKNKKTERTNTGNRGARKTPMDKVALIRMGKGAYVNINKSKKLN